ncbi:uncharacterized protein LOC131328531 [Rhododendron vialii]|uniref:uncharacterized protein LOC131328531 n=1 Tax=Rhododendron vialii TaxID=182163 RepID=UPI00265F1BE5|nr:uncharacterized protein LOC131328531 [Rhododendron vialii]
MCSATRCICSGTPPYSLDKYSCHKIVPVSAHKSVEEVKALYQELIGPMITESNRPITASTKQSFKSEVINEDNNLEEDLDEIGLQDLEATSAQLDDLKADVQNPLEEVNLGDSKNPRPVYISQLLPEDVKEKLIQLLTEFRSCFAWNYDELPGLSRDLVEHKLPIQRRFRPFKQPPRRMSNEVYLQVKDEIEHLFNAGFIRMARYVTWLSNVVSVLKKNGKIRVCVDFRNLNLASPKDEYPMPVADLLVDGASGHRVLSFMDGHSGYNQIFIDEVDTAKTAFRCPGALGTFEWVVMPFGLKNARASFQRGMNAIFHDFIGRFMEIYIDDIVVKSQSYEEHLEHLRRSFLRMQQFDLKVNPLKCAFGVSAGKFLGFLVHNRGIEIDKNKAKAIIEAKPPTTKREFQKLLGSFNFLRRFISNLAGKVQVFSQLLWLKDQDTFVWEASHQKAFDEIKGYLAKAPVLMPPIKNKPLKLYISAVKSFIGCLLAQDNKQGKEQAVYYLSRLLTPCERRYTLVEKLCLSLYFAAIKLRHYMLPVVVYIMSQTGLIKYLLCQPIIRGRIGKWSLALMEFSFQYVPQKAVKGQALADFLADHPCVDIGKESDTGLTEYEAMVIGLEILRDLQTREVKVIGDSNLVINHLARTFKCYNEELAPYYMAAVQLIQDFDNVIVKHVSRSMYTEANSLAQALTGRKLSPETLHNIITVQKRLLPSVRRKGLGLEVLVLDLPVEEEEEGKEDWRDPIIAYLKQPHTGASRKVKRRALSYVLLGDELYKKGLKDDLLLRCLCHTEAMKVMAEVHEGICGAHQSGIKMRWLIRRYGYYWPTILEDCIRFSKGCQPCQAHGPIHHTPATDYQAVVKPWPFRGWALDVIGIVYPPSSKQHKFILVATDYFTKWAEAFPLRSVDQQDVIKVMKEKIIHRFGIPEHFVVDRGLVFFGAQVRSFASQFNIQLSHSTPYYAQGNGQAESTNKTLIGIIEKMIEENPRVWHELLSDALWAYRTSKKEATNVTPYMLVYGHDLILPTEVTVRSARIAYQNGLSPAYYSQAMLMEMEDLDEVRLAALDHMLVQKRHVAKAYNRRVRRKSFTEGDLVWQVFKGNVYLLMGLDGGMHKHTINGNFLKHHYPTMWEMRDFNEKLPSKP